MESFEGNIFKLNIVKKIFIIRYLITTKITHN